MGRNGVRGLRFFDPKSEIVFGKNPDPEGWILHEEKTFSVKQMVAIPKQAVLRIPIAALIRRVGPDAPSVA
jgi:hypothetical protein